MKKKNLKSLKLNKNVVTKFSTTSILGGTKMSIIVQCPIGPSDDTLDFDCPSFWC